jgi:hypothetical protein
MVDHDTGTLPGNFIEASEVGWGEPAWPASARLWAAYTAAVAGGGAVLGTAPLRDAWPHFFVGADVPAQMILAMTFVGVLGIVVGGICGAVAGAVHGAAAGSAWRAVVSLSVGAAGGVVFGAIGGALTPLLISALREALPAEGAAGLAWAIAGAPVGWAACKWKRAVERAARKKARVASGDGG